MRVKDKGQGAAQVLATACIYGMSLQKIHMAWTGPATSTFQKIFHVLGEPYGASL